MAYDLGSRGPIGACLEIQIWVDGFGFWVWVRPSTKRAICSIWDHLWLGISWKVCNGHKVEGMGPLLEESLVDAEQNRVGVGVGFHGSF
ncbi:hypothetical protein Sjap_010992 [Stephania japonica]|uniref:Uncharacterized protein n=1 Tax=Stephania japonica TaxID=461633 RepID=A0AAP0JBI5_9MAGN